MNPDIWPQSQYAPLHCLLSRSLVSLVGTSKHTPFGAKSRRVASTVELVSGLRGRRVGDDGHLSRAVRATRAGHRWLCPPPTPPGGAVSTCLSPGAACRSRDERRALARGLEHNSHFIFSRNKSVFWKRREAPGSTCDRVCSPRGTGAAWRSPRRRAQLSQRRPSRARSASAAKPPGARRPLTWLPVPLPRCARMSTGARWCPGRRSVSQR